VLPGFALWGPTEVALFHVLVFGVIGGFRFLFHLLQVVVPVLRGVVVPRVDEVDLFSLHLLLGALLWAVLVYEVVLVLLPQVVQPILQIIADYFDGYLSLLPFLELALVFHLVGVVGKDPEPDLSKDGAQVFLHGLEEVTVTESEDLLDEVLPEDSHHPDLAVLDEPSRPEVESVLAEAVGKGVLHLIDVGFMEVDHFLLICQIRHVGGLLRLEEDGAEVGVVAFEESVELIEGGHPVQEALL